MKFEFKTKPFDHQLKIFEESKDREYYGLWMEQGTGKTKIIIDTASWLFLNGKISAAIIFANKGVYGNWYYEELPKHSPIPYRTYMWRGFGKLPEHEEFKRALGRGDMVWFIMNVDALTVPRMGALVKKFIEAHPLHMVVGDETTSIKNFKSARTKAAMKLREKAAYRRVMSGLPNPQSPLDLFSQCQFLKPGVLGHSSYFSMKNHYGVPEIFHFGNRSFSKITSYRDLEGLRRRLLKFSAILKKDDCLDLPPKVYRTMYVDLTDVQRRAYDELLKRAVTYIEEHEITAINALALVTRLLQICCGQLKVGDNEYVSIENNRLSAVEDLVDEAANKVIVWTSYRRTAVDLVSKLGTRAVLIPGGLTAEEKYVRIQEWRNGNAKALVANPASSGHGLTLTEADLVVYYSNSWNLEHRMQSEDRTHRIGQTKSVQYIDLVAPGTIEGRVIQILKDKKTLSDQVINNKTFEEFLTS